MDKDYRLINMNDVEAEEVEWLWEGFIPYGKLTILHGDPARGKTMAMLNIIAALTTGRDMFSPPGSPQVREPVNVIYQTAEDGLADTIKPRLLAAGADCGRITSIDDSYRALSMSDRRIEKAIEDTGARLLVLDPLQAFLGARVDMHRANEVRPQMKHLSDVATRQRCAVVLIGHLNKNGKASIDYRGLGSIDFMAAARSVILCTKSREDPDVRVLVTTKQSLTYEHTPVAFRISKDRGFEWIGEYEEQVGGLLVPTGVKGQKTFSAIDFLKEVIPEDGELIASSDVLKQAEENGIAEKTLRNAMKISGVESVRVGDKWFMGYKDSEQ